MSPLRSVSGSLGESGRAAKKIYCVEDADRRYDGEYQGQFQIPIGNARCDCDCEEQVGEDIQRKECG